MRTAADEDGTSNLSAFILSPIDQINDWPRRRRKTHGRSRRCDFGPCVVDEGPKRSVDSITIVAGLGIQIAFANESVDFGHVYLIRRAEDESVLSGGFLSGRLLPRKEEACYSRAGPLSSNDEELSKPPLDWAGIEEDAALKNWPEPKAKQ